MTKFQKKINIIFDKALNNDVIGIIELLTKDFIDVNNLKLYDIINKMEEENVDTFKYLYEIINPSQDDIDDSFYFSVRKDFVQIAKILVNKITNIDKNIKLGHSLIYSISNNSSYDMILFLIDEGADLNVKDDYAGASAMFRAIEKCNINVVKLLIEKGSNLDYINSGLYVIPHVNSNRNFKNSYDLTLFLIEIGADVNFISNKESSVLRVSCIWGRPDIAKLLIDNGATIDIQHFDILLTLFVHYRVTLREAYFDLLSTLITKGIDLKSMSYEAIKAAVYTNDTNLVTFLINKGIDIKSHDDKSEENDFFIISIKDDFFNRIAIIKLLIDNGANIHTKNNLAFEIARKKTNKNVLELLQKYCY